MKEKPGPLLAVKRLLQAIKDVKSTDPDRAKEAIETANATLDIERLGRRSLGREQWEKLGPAGRKEFIQLLRRIFEVRAYPKSAEFFKDLQIKYRDVAIRENKAIVRTTVIHPDEGRVDIDYRLRKNESSWIVYEVYMDEVPMGANLRNQIRKELEKNGYEALVKHLREKIETFEKESGT